MNKILIYGAGALGLIVAEMLEQEEILSEDIVFVDDNLASEINYDQAKRLFSPRECDMIIAIGYKNLNNRLAIYQKIKKDGYRLRNIIHPEACVNLKTTIGDGCIIMEKAVVGLHAILSDIVVMWSGAIVSHDSIIGKNTFLSPNSTVCGFAEIGQNSFIGAGAIIADHAKLSSNSFVKAGIVVK